MPDPQTFLWHFGQTAHLQPSVVCLLPSQQTALIVPSSHFPANYSLHFFLHSIPPSPFLSCRSFSFGCYPSLLATAVATAAVMWPLPNHYCRLLAQNKKLKQVKPGGCWTESRMNESLLEGRASLHRAFAAPDCKGKSIPIKSINSLPSGNNKDFYWRINQTAGYIAIRCTPICPSNENA